MLILLLFVLNVVGLISCAPKVRLGSSTVVGRGVSRLQQDFFGGIPYAEPPVGALRLEPPVLKLQPDNETFDASNFGLPCIQADLSADSMSENCLSINIFRPSNTSLNASLPVLFWTHGSGFKQGGSYLFNASQIVAQSMSRGTPIIFVSINYRLGPLGWPQGAEASSRGLLNLGIKDQMIALEWVQQNIGAFGGDKSKVTTGGASAGSIMTSALFLNTSISSLTRGAILESGYAATYPLFNASHHQDSWESFVNGIDKCKSFAQTSNTIPCLQTTTTSDIIKGVNASLSTTTKTSATPGAFAPVLDGPNGFFPDLPSRLYEQGQFARLPFIAGTNLDEGTHFVPPNQNYTTETIALALEAAFTPPAIPLNVVKELLTLYPDDPAVGSPFGTGNETFSLSPGFKRAAALITDIEFESLRRTWTQTVANAGVKAFGYHFTQDISTLPSYLGVTHGSQVPFTFDSLAAEGVTDDASINLSHLMIEYFVSFTVSLNPNDGVGLNRPTWPQYTSDNKMLLQLNGNNLTSIPDSFREEQISYIISQNDTFHH